MSYSRQLPPELLTALRSRRISCLSISGETGGHLLPCDWSCMENVISSLLEVLVDCLVELHLDLRRVLPIVSSLEGLVNQLTRHHRLVTLYLDWTCRSCDSPGVLTAFKEFRQLEKLMIPLKSLPDLQSLFKSVHHLDCLSVHGLKLAREESLRAALPLGRRISSLALTNCRLGDDDILAINDHMENQLLTMDISRNHIGDVAVKDICIRQIRLTSLDVSRTDMASTGLRAITGKLTQLVSLCACHCRAMVAAEDAMYFKGLVHLQYLDLSRCGVVQSSVNLPETQLINLNLSFCAALEYWTWTASLSCLRCFDISGCTGLTRKVLANVIQGIGDWCTNLTSLNVSCLLAINDAVLLGQGDVETNNAMSIVSSERMLLKSRSGSSFGSQTSIPASTSLVEYRQDESAAQYVLKFKCAVTHKLGILKLSKLQRFSLKGCSRITNETVAHGFQFPLLTELDISDLNLVREWRFLSERYSL